MSRIEDIEGLTVEEALKLKEGRVRREFPSEFLQATVKDVIAKAKAGNQNARTARKLLVSNQYDKKKE